MIPTPLRHLLRALGLAIVLLIFDGSTDASAQTSPFHPTFPLLDAEGVNVLESGLPISTMRTCGACHDAAFIEGHSFHADVGLSTLRPRLVRLRSPGTSAMATSASGIPLPIAISRKGDPY